ncbi:MAG: hypothetical protein M1827_002131 [Pycnora praestabilis]|nr:MAG: hypothetical protein M1827_002131 [Pycnora praestabilis]
MSSPHTVRWGILATGGIAATFTKDLMIDPSTRGVKNITHTVVAAASSSSASRAEKFLSECKVPSGAAAYGSYEELVADKNVDIVYVATPHSHHFQNTMLALNANKHVLCEKAFTTNAAQTKILVETARKKKLFLMEAVWTRFFPLSVKIREMVTKGELGDVHRVVADNSFGEDVESVWGTEHRMVNMDLAGGALLDLGIYSLTWVFQILYHCFPVTTKSAPQVASSITKYHKTGADEKTSVIVTFPNTGAHGIALTNLRVASNPDGHHSAGPAIRIQGTKAEVQVYGPAFRPTRYRIIPVGDGKGEPKVEDHEVEIPGHGMFWEADECARCLRDGKLESEVMGLEESIVIMEVMDAVRRQNDLVYPEAIESTKYPYEGFDKK